MLILNIIKKYFFILLTICSLEIRADQIEDIFSTPIAPSVLTLTIGNSTEQYIFDKIDGSVYIYHNSNCNICRLIVSNGSVGIMGIVTTPSNLYHIESDKKGTYLIDATTLTYPKENDDEVFVSPVQPINSFGIVDSSIFQDILAIQRDENIISNTTAIGSLMYANENRLQSTYTWYNGEIDVLNTTLTTAKNVLASDIANQSNSNVIATDQQNVVFIQSIITSDTSVSNTLSNQYKSDVYSIKNINIILNKEQNNLTTDETLYRNAIAEIDNKGVDNVIDIMVVYTTENQSAEYALQRIQLLIAITNQAYADSYINLKLCLVHTEATSYTEGNSNDIALSDLFEGNNEFSTIAQKRNIYGADLVYLFRPLNVSATGNCGETYVEFANVSHSDSRLGYGVISDGYDINNNSYHCGYNTFAHQVGHSLGLVHDRENSTEYGATPWSYTWDNHGAFPTIMSNNIANLMVFSSFYLSNQCNGQPCGYPGTNVTLGSDQSNTMNITAPVVSRFQPSVTLLPNLQ